MTAADSSSHAGWLRVHPRGCTLSVRIQPGAKKSAILGVYGEGEEAALKIAIQAPPIEGRANDALIAFLAELCELPKSRVEILCGQSSRSKLILLHGLDLQAALERLHAEP
ncbi:MAG TPA: DUF167 domain-containing protein [Acidobacteriaceae bacterium]|nr:DUF167 domain-containing protein [Acidobacteriaceae bacterium]